MSTELATLEGINLQRYAAVLRISEGLSACRDSQLLAKIIADQLDDVLSFEHLDLMVLKEDSKEIEWHAWGKGALPFPDLPVEERMTWHVHNTQQPLHIADWNSDARVPQRLRQVLTTLGINIGSVLRVPLTTPHRRLGTLGIVSAPGVTYTGDDVAFLRLIARAAAFAIDDGLNFGRAEAAQTSLQQQNDRLQLLLDLTTRITSSLDLREVLRTVATNIREVMHVDGVTVSLPDSQSEKVRVVAVDFPGGKGIIKEELLVTPSVAALNAMETLRPVVLGAGTDELPSDVHALRAAEGIRAACLIPLVNRGRLVAMLSILRQTEVPFRQEDVDFLWRASGQIAIAFENALVIEERKRAEEVLAVQNTRLELLLKLTERITSKLELRNVLREVSTSIREVMRVDAAGFAFFDEDSGKSKIFAVDFPEAKGFVREEIVVTPGLALKRALKSSKPEIMNENDSAELGADVYAMVVAEGLNAHCLIPLVSRGRSVGVLIVARKQQGSITADDVDFLSRASGQIAIAVENALAYREISELKDKLAQEKLYLEEEIRTEMDFERIVGSSAALKHVLQLVETVAPSDSTVLLLGETGTGKELIARAIHDRSRRKERTFVKLNCAAIPTGLLESELFGHEKGAFTGAISQKIGRMELSDQGTLFLDEVGDIPIDIQPKLLRVLQEQEFERLGSTHTRKVNTRLIAATNRDLEKMIADREFRSDLFYRLNVFPIRIPPLRDRREDIPILVSYFVQKFAKRMQKKIETIPAATMKSLAAWGWPGNIRELENFIERAVILTRGKSLEAPLYELHKPAVEAAPTSASRPSNDLERFVKEAVDAALNEKKRASDEYSQKQRAEIVQALKEAKGQVGGADGAAARMGVNRTTFISRMKKLGVDPRQYI